MFINALMLAGIGGAVVPLVLHLLSRARHREVEWGAMMFLRDESNRQHSSARLRQWTLLLTRMAIVGLLAVALARPVVSAAGWGAGNGGGGHTTTVVVFDCSASMTYDADATGRSRFDLARDAVLQVLAAQRPGDRVALVPAGDPSSRPRAAPEPTDDTQAVAVRLADLRPSASAADLAESLDAALTILEREPPGGAAHVYVVTDAQASNWRGVDADSARDWRSRARAIQPRVQLRVVPVGGDGTENLAVDALAPIGSPAVKGVATEFEVTVRNHGAIARTAVPLVVRDLAAGARAPDLYSTTLDVGPRASAAVRFSATFADPGPRTLAANVGPTAGPTFDDRLALALDVVETLNVLIISGDERPEPFRGESDFFRAALTPFKTSGRPGADLAAVEVKPADAWGEADLAGRQVVVLANVAEVAPQQARALEQFVSAGGGLLIAPGDLSRPEAYNQTFHRQGAGVMPVPIAAPVTGGAERGTMLASVDLAHPVFRFIAGRADALPSEPLARYFASDVSLLAQQPSGPRVLASYRSGEPFLIGSSFGRGRVLMMTAPLDADWGRLPLTKFYLPFVQSMARHLASAALPARNIEPGEEVRLVVSPPSDGGQWVVRMPDGRNATARAVDLGGGREELRFADTARPGTYTARSKAGGQPREIQFVVRPPRQESDLSPLSEQRWSELADWIDVRRVDATPEALAADTSGPRSGRELWPALLALVMALAALELVLARLWSAGP